MDYAVFLLLLLVSAFFSGSETALFSLGKVTRARLRRSEVKADRRVAALLAHPQELLVTVLLGNELTNIAISIVAASITSQWVTGYSLLAQAVLSAAIAFPILLVFGEITPKTLAARRAEPLARVAAPLLTMFAWVTRPLRLGLRRLTRAIVSRFGGTVHEDRGLGESEFRTLVDAGTRAGVVEANERRLIHNVLDFGDLQVREVMRPFETVVSLNERTPITEAIEVVRSASYSRIPVWRRDPRLVEGVVHAKDLLAIHWGAAPPVTLRKLLRRAVFTLPHRPADELMEEFRRKGSHMAVVVDEFGKAVGLCTMEDLLEELFGPIYDARGERPADAPEEGAEARQEAPVTDAPAAAPAPDLSEREPGDA